MNEVAETQSTRERICEAALLGFAERGVARTSIRDVAAAVGISAGVVQYHFASKGKLREAVHEYVIAKAVDLFAELPAGESASEIQQELGDRVTSMTQEHPEAVLYVARLTADEDPAAFEIFDALLEIANDQWQRLASEGVLRSDVDLGWAALQAIVLILGTALFEGAIGRHLPAPWRDPKQLERWNRANSELFRRGLYA
jgi:AcrR family transcriptional regulator